MCIIRKRKHISEKVNKERMGQTLKENYESLEMEIIEFEARDVVATSDEGEGFEW